MRTRRAMFWLGVAGVAIGANVALELAARWWPQPGLVRFVHFVHCGPSSGGQG